MNIYKQLALTTLAAIPACAMAQGSNHGLGGKDELAVCTRLEPHAQGKCTRRQA